MSAVKKYLLMIKFEHTIFALPFAYIGMFMGFKDGVDITTLILVTVAMASARSAAMSLNRIIDRHIDAKNARTKNREIPSGKVKLKEVYFFTILSLIIFEFSAYLINNLAFMLSPIALFFVITYSYTKRFTYLSHLYLGATDAIAPLGGYIASADGLSAPIWYLAIFVMFWIGGFDILYALQDREFDSKNHLHSIPVKFGVDVSLHISKAFHVIGFLFLILSAYTFGLNYISYIGFIAVAVLLVIEHKLVDPNDVKKVNLAFFNINSYISVVLFITFIAGRYL